MPSMNTRRGTQNMQSSQIKQRSRAAPRAVPHRPPSFIPPLVYFAAPPADPRHTPRLASDMSRATAAPRRATCRAQECRHSPPGAARRRPRPPVRPPPRAPSSAGCRLRAAPTAAHHITKRQLLAYRKCAHPCGRRRGARGPGPAPPPSPAPPTPRSGAGASQGQRSASGASRHRTSAAAVVAPVMRR